MCDTWPYWGLTVQPVLTAVSQTELGKDNESATHTRTAAPAFHKGGKEKWRNVGNFSAKCFSTMSAICFLCGK